MNKALMISPRIGQRCHIGGRYAPTAQFSQTYDQTTQIVSGFAAPEKGPLPCAVVLLVGSEIVSVARAARFSMTAKSSDIRFGWCGYELSGLSDALALEGEPVIQCAATDHILHVFDRSGFDGPARLTRDGLTARGVLQAAQLSHGTTDLDAILPFIGRYAATHNNDEILNALYRAILFRAVDDSGRATWGERLRAGIKAESLASTLFDIATQEMVGGPSVLLGPFDGRFPFGRELFD